MSDRADELALDRTATGIALWIHVTPRANRPKVAGIHDAALRVAVAAAPVGGQANAACRDALAKALACKRIDIEIDPASKGRRKRVKLAGDAVELRQKLLALASLPGLG